MTFAEYMNCESIKANCYVELSPEDCHSIYRMGNGRHKVTINWRGTSLFTYWLMPNNTTLYVINPDGTKGNPSVFHLDIMPDFEKSPKNK
jgi:hypothetical protein